MLVPARQKLLGVGPWKFLQQGTYVAFVLVALHSVIFLYGGHHGGAAPVAMTAQADGTAAAAPAPGRQAKMRLGTTAPDGLVRPEGKGGEKSTVSRWVVWGATLAVVGLQGAGFVATVRKKKAVSRMGGEAAGTP